MAGGVFLAYFWGFLYDSIPICFQYDDLSDCVESINCGDVAGNQLS
jgi:hypothetical protein